MEFLLTASSAGLKHQIKLTRETNYCMVSYNAEKIMLNKFNVRDVTFQYQ